MSVPLIEQVTSALAQFSSASRLYELTVGDRSANPGAGGLLVEAFAADDEVQGIGGRDVIALSTDAQIALEPLLGQPARLEVSLADGTRIELRLPKLVASPTSDRSEDLTESV